MNRRRARYLADLIDVDQCGAFTDFHERSDCCTTGAVAQSHAFADANSRNADVV
jgi:hypothetical protein